MKPAIYIIIFLTPLLLSSCGKTGSLKTKHGTAVHKLEYPRIPAVLTGDSARVAYMASHWWDNFDMADTTWIADTAVMEQAFADWVGILMRMPERQAARLTGQLIRLADTLPAMQLRFAEIAELYFAGPNSPFRNEELFIPVLESIIASPDIDSVYKLRPRSMLASAMKNRPGIHAADLNYTTSKGVRGTLYSLQAEYVLLLFYNPGCHDCERVERFITESEVFSPLVASGRMKVLAIYPDEDLTEWRKHLPQMPGRWIAGHSLIGRTADAPYDLPAIPNLYLLDHDKTVILKDAPVERIEAYMSGR